jgi:hypothetical protein
VIAFIAATAKSGIIPIGKGAERRVAMKSGVMLALAAIFALGGAGAAPAQMRTVDPNQASDLAPVPATEADYGTKVTPPEPAPAAEVPAAPQAAEAPAAEPSTVQEVGSAPRVTPKSQAQAMAANNNTYEAQDVLSAAEGVFGKGAAGLAGLIEKIFKEQGKPNAYIAGREGGAAIGIGLRYGSGTMFHKVEGQLPVYWTGPSLGFDLGANGAKSFVLVYNLFDTEDIFQRYPGVEGTAYIVGGFTATFLRSGDIVLIPIRLGVGWRLGINVGYMKFTKKSRIMPF